MKKLRRDKTFSTRVPYANKKIRETHFSMTKTKFKKTGDKIKYSQILKSKTKLKFQKNRGESYDHTTYMQQSIF